MNRSVENLPKRATQVDNLPPPNTRRWVVRRKAAVVAAVRDGMITMASALHRYQLTEDEFLSWQRAFERYGLLGLRATFVQQYREPRQPRRPRQRLPHYADPGPAPPNLGAEANI